MIATEASLPSHSQEWIRQIIISFILDLSETAKSSEEMQAKLVILNTAYLAD